MTRAKLLSLFVAAAMTCASSLAHSEQDSVLTFHGHADRSGHFVVPKLTWERARSVHLDERFHAPVSGHEGDNRLHGFRGDTGEPLFSGNGRALAGLRRFQTVIATHDRLYVAADGRVYAFSF